MYYRLKDQYLLRGWKKLPYAILDKETTTVGFMNGMQFGAVQICNGTLRADSPLIFPAQRNFIEKLVEQGIIEKNKQLMSLKAEQDYKTYPARYVHNVHWSVTGKCNCKCRHCYMSAPHAKNGELSKDDCIRIIDQIAECGIQSVSLTGGECLVRKDFLELVDRILFHGIRLSQIYSNGLLVNEKLLSQLEERGIHPEFNMSFDGIGEQDWMRGIPGTEEAVIKAFKLCKSKGFPYAFIKKIHILFETASICLLLLVAALLK